MEGLKVLRNTQIIILGVCIAAATIVSTVILSQGLLKKIVRIVAKSPTDPTKHYILL